MITISSKRVQGAGKGTEIGFPTINFILDELPNGLGLGLYASIFPRKVKYYTAIFNCLSLISMSRGKYRIETHVIDEDSININIDESIELSFLGKLRDTKKTRDIEKLIVDDINLTSDFFKKTKTCLNCQLCYIQDYGYSNYTVEGTEIGCYANVFEKSDCDYNRDTIIQYNAIGCNYMVDGEYWNLDVDGESDRPTEGWIKSVLRDVKLSKLL